MTAAEAEPAAPPENGRIVIATAGSLGDLHPFLAIAQELRRRGLAPVVATLACYRRHVADAGIAFHAVRPHLDMDDPAFMRSIAASARGLDRIVAEHLIPRWNESLEDLRACAQGAAAVVAGPLSYAAPAAADACGLPWCQTILSPRYVPTNGRALPRRVPADPRLRPPCAVLALFSRLLGGPEPPRPGGTTITGFAFYDGGHAAGTGATLERFLADGPAPIVFTLGSAAVFDPGGFFEESVAAARRLRRRAVVLTGANAAPPRLPDTVLALPYAPFPALFPRAAAIVHHGGIGTLGHALRSGRPMLVVPRFLDQPDNAARARRLGVARIMHATAYQAGAVASELRALLDTPGYTARARQIAAAVRLERGAAGACDAIERTLARGSALVTAGRGL